MPKVLQVAEGKCGGGIGVGRGVSEDMAMGKCDGKGMVIEGVAGKYRCGWECLGALKCGWA